jgi:hypothetical protein
MTAEILMPGAQIILSSVGIPTQQSQWYTRQTNSFHARADLRKQNTAQIVNKYQIFYIFFFGGQEDSNELLDILVTSFNFNIIPSSASKAKLSV